MTLKNSESFEWPEELSIEKVLEGMDRYLVVVDKKKQAPAKQAVAKKEAAAKKDTPKPAASKPVAKVKTSQKVPKNQQAPKDVGSLLYSGTRTIGGGKSFFLSVFDTHSKSCLFVKVSGSLGFGLSHGYVH